jgi:hypothetical protein
LCPDTPNAHRHSIRAGAFDREDVPLTSPLPNTPHCDQLNPFEEIRLPPTASSSDTLIEMAGRSVTVPGIAPTAKCKLATRPSEWEAAFRLVAANYKQRGYEPPDSPPVRFTPFHALPQTVTLIAQTEDRVVATLSLVFDNDLLGLPMQSIYAEELDQLRRQGRSLVEVTSLADTSVTPREFMPIFVTLMRILTQYGLAQGADTFVISINPRHRAFYRKVMGFEAFGPRRAYPNVQNHPAEAFLLEKPMLKAHSLEMYEQIVERALPTGTLWARPMPLGLVHYFSNFANQADRRLIQDVLVAIDADETACRAAVG